MTDVDDIAIGVSACLLGFKVRFDGGHKHEHSFTQTLAKHVRFVSVCPEVESGMPIPRESIRLVQKKQALHVLGNKTGFDYTQTIEAWSEEKVTKLGSENLCGYIFKKDSPSCGMERVKVYDENSTPSRTGMGVFARAFKATYPLIPTEEEGRLNDPLLRENFFTRVFAYKRLQNLFKKRWSLKDVIAFHTQEKLLLMAHHPETYRLLGRYVAEGHAVEREVFSQQYQKDYMRGLSYLATVKKNVNVLQHASGYFKKIWNASEKQAVHESIVEYQRMWIPLVVPVTLLRYHIGIHDVEYLKNQTYFSPHPKELMLRNHV